MTISCNLKERSLALKSPKTVKKTPNTIILIQRPNERAWTKSDATALRAFLSGPAGTLLMREAENAAIDALGAGKPRSVVIGAKLMLEFIKRHVGQDDSKPEAIGELVPIEISVEENTADTQRGHREA